MGIFGPDRKPVVTRREWDKYVVPHLRDQGYDHRDIRAVEDHLSGYWDSDGTNQHAGISSKEVPDVVDTLKKNSPHHFSDDKIKALSDSLQKHW